MFSNLNFKRNVFKKFKLHCNKSPPTQIIFCKLNLKTDRIGCVSLVVVDHDLPFLESLLVYQTPLILNHRWVEPPTIQAHTQI